MSRPQIANLTALDAAGAAQAIRTGEITSEALVRACLARIAEREGDVQAWAHLDPEVALTQARDMDALQRSGGAMGPLHGVPIGIKDIFDTAALPTEYGCPIFDGWRPKKDAACVTLLRAAGAIVLGKTVTTELALLTPARTRNPRNLKHTPGGSSAGSAAAVAAGMVPAALGSQTAGSVIRPASFCGVYGFKPTLGLIPRAGVLMQSHTLDTVGVYGSSVEDLALLADCMAAFEPDDTVSFIYEGPKLLDTARQDPKTAPRFAFVKTPAWADADPAMHAAFARLVESLDGCVKEIEIKVLADVIEWQRIVQLAENAYYYGPLMRDAPDMLSGGLKARLEAGLEADVQDYIRALASREDAYREVARSFADYDAILTPSAAGPAPKGFETTGSPVFNGLWTYLGMPAVSLPLLEADGMPLGVQLVGARRGDARLLRTARWLAGEVARKG
jgi:Asp-tRNA(Asn)/Glu-tRNA(Gln) amidotransferase A subunit family amidase